MSKPITLEQIMEWASVFTGENRSGREYYYVPEVVKRLEWSLTHVSRQLIALIGLQGTGKTSALYHLAYALQKAKINETIIKWTENWRDTLFLREDFVKFESECIVNAIKEEFLAYKQSHKLHPFLKRNPSLGYDEESANRAYEKVNFQADLIIGKSRVKEAREEALHNLLDSCKVILIDLPDYTKTDRRVMSKHLSEVQALWESIELDKNIVIAIQKELFTGHFFFGKMDVRELTPLKPEEFLHVFKTQFPNCGLITDNALLLLGQLCRGVFRRFLKYLKLTTETFAVSNEAPPIDVKHVNNAITIEELMKDMELELYDIFKDANQRRQAIELLNRLREGSMNQKEISEFLNVSEATAGKIVNKLLTYRYIERQRAEGKAWSISLKV